MKIKATLNLMEINRESYCVIALKDHVVNFDNSATTFLVNTAKNLLRIISKIIQDEINSKIHKMLKFSMWESSRNKLDWFRSIKEALMEIYYYLWHQRIILFHHTRSSKENIIFC